MSMSVEMILRLIDQATGPLRGVSREVDHLKQSTAALNAQQAKGAAGGGVKASLWFDQQKQAEAEAKHQDARRRAIVATAGKIGEAAGVTASAVAGFGLHEAIRFETAMADVKKKINLDPGATWGDVEGMINRTARATGIARVEMAALFGAAGQAGVEYKNLGTSTLLAAKAASAWDMAPQEAAKQIAEIQAATQFSGRELADFADKVNALGDTSAAAERDILSMFKRSAGAAKSAGVSYDTVLSITTALKSTGMDESKTATFLNAMMSTLRTAGEGGRGAKAAAEGFRMLGLSVKDVQSGMRTDSTKTILDVLDRLNKSPKGAEAGVRIFGKQWWDEAAQGGAALGKIVEYLRLISSGEYKAHSLDQNFKTEMDTTEKQLARVKAAASEIGNDLMGWALPPIKGWVDDFMKVYSAWKDGPPKDIVYSPTRAEAEKRLEEARKNRGKGESGAQYEARLGLDREVVGARPTPIPYFTQPRPEMAQRTIPSGAELPTFAGMGGQPGAIHVDTSQLAGAAQKATSTGQAIVEALGVTGTPEVDMTKIQGAAGEAQSVGQAILAGLSVTARPQVDTSSLAAALGMTRELSASLSSLGAKAASAGAAVQRGVAAGRGALHDGPEGH